MDPEALAVAGAGLFLAGVLKGVTGLGYSTCALPFLAIAVGLERAIALVIVPAIASNFALTVFGGAAIETVKRFRWLYLSLAPGIVAGVGLLVILEAALASRILGLATLAYVAIAATGPERHLPHRMEIYLQAPAGFATGLLTGLTGSQILPLLPFFLALRLAPDRFVQAVNIAVLLASPVLAASLFAGGFLTRDLAILSFAGLIPALAGLAIGGVLRGFLPVRVFRCLVLVVLTVLGTLLAAPDRTDQAIKSSIEFLSYTKS